MRGPKAYNDIVKQITAHHYRERIHRVILYIESHLKEGLALATLAEISHFSPYHFHRIFRGFTGESVYRYVSRLKMQWVAGQLKYSERNLLDLALDIGYESHEALTRAFKREMGRTPSAFRREIREDLPPAPQRMLGYQGEAMTYTVTLREEKPRHLATIHHIGPYDEVGSAFEQLLDWAGPQGLLGPGTEVLGICYDDPDLTPSQKIRYDAAITVDEGINAEGAVSLQVLPGGPHARLTHQGPYRLLSNTYNFFYGEWLPQSGREPADRPPFEVYLNSPEETEEEELLTDIYLPLKG